MGGTVFVWVECKRRKASGRQPVPSFRWRLLQLNPEQTQTGTPTQHGVSSHMAALCVTTAWRQRGPASDHEVSSVDHWYSSPSPEDIYFAGRLVLGRLPLRHLPFRLWVSKARCNQMWSFCPEATGLQLNCWLSSALSSQSHRRLLTDFICLSILGLRRCFYWNHI